MLNPAWTCPISYCFDTKVSASVAAGQWNICIACRANDNWQKNGHWVCFSRLVETSFCRLYWLSLQEFKSITWLDKLLNHCEVVSIYRMFNFVWVLQCWHRAPADLRVNEQYSKEIILFEYLFEWLSSGVRKNIRSIRWNEVQSLECLCRVSYRCNFCKMEMSGIEDTLTHNCISGCATVFVTDKNSLQHVDLATLPSGCQRRITDDIPDQTGWKPHLTWN